MSNTTYADLGYPHPPHYCTHAIEFFKDLSKELPLQLGVPADLEDFLIESLTTAVKFLLPDNGYLFAGPHDFKPAMFDLLRLPFPVCALEFTATEELYAAGSGLHHAVKRIALCFNPRALTPLQTQRLAGLTEHSTLASLRLPERCLAVLSIYEAQGVWGASVGMVVVDLDNDQPMPLANASEATVGPGWSNLAANVEARIHPEGASGPNRRMSKHGLPVTFHPFPGRSRLVGQSQDEALEALYIDTIDEMRAAYEFLAAINCANVDTSELPPPRMLNEKRAKKGKTLFYPYKVLNLNAHAGDGDGMGTHASPRTHLRRGHIRRLGEKFGNKVLWINATTVNLSKSPEMA